MDLSCASWTRGPPFPCFTGGHKRHFEWTEWSGSHIPVSSEDWWEHQGAAEREAVTAYTPCCLPAGSPGCRGTLPRDCCHISPFQVSPRASPAPGCGAMFNVMIKTASFPAVLLYPKFIKICFPIFVSRKIRNFDSEIICFFDVVC